MFPGRRPDTRRSGIDAVWYLVRSESNLEDVRLHDLRHAFAVRALESTLSAERRDVARHMLTLSTYLGQVPRRVAVEVATRAGEVRTGAELIPSSGHERELLRAVSALRQQILLSVYNRLELFSF